jgi:hypothetical protein
MYDTIKYIIAGIEGLGVQTKEVETWFDLDGTAHKMYYISVPDSSDCYGADDQMMAGSVLASRTLGIFQQIFPEEIEVMFISRHEHWTQEKQYDTENRTLCDLSGINPC